ncbi:MAG: nucleotidyltransferase domain-containing protein [Chloroflexi bacterium]|nr:nucleotidyltransferase domain-containing protein [Chloroflexota bacterium]
MSETVKANRGLVNLERIPDSYVGRPFGFPKTRKVCPPIKVEFALGIPEALYPALGCFVDYASSIPHLRFAVLFGSTVTGEFRKKSDIDILLAFETDHDPELGPEAETALRVSSFIADKFDLANSFSFVYVNLRDPNLDPHFVWQVAKEGVVLWGNPALLLAALAQPRAEPLVLITYSTQGLDAATKGALHRTLYGYAVTKRVNGKEYHSARPGLVEGGGRRIALSLALSRLLFPSPSPHPNTLYFTIA